MRFGTSVPASVTALLNIDWTLVNSVNCTNCVTHIYNASGSGVVIDQETISM